MHDVTLAVALITVIAWRAPLCSALLCTGRGGQTDFPAVVCIGSGSSLFVCLSLVCLTPQLSLCLCLATLPFFVAPFLPLSLLFSLSHFFYYPFIFFLTIPHSYLPSPSSTSSSPPPWSLNPSMPWHTHTHTHLPSSCLSRQLVE